MLPRGILGWHRENIFCDRVGSHITYQEPGTPQTDGGWKRPRWTKEMRVCLKGDVGFSC